MVGTATSETGSNKEEAAAEQEKKKKPQTKLRAKG
jgi:hypothetical protein